MLLIRNIKKAHRMIKRKGETNKQSNRESGGEIRAGRGIRQTRTPNVGKKKYKKRKGKRKEYKRK